MLSEGNTQEENVPESRLDLPGRLGFAGAQAGRAERSKMGLQIAPGRRPRSSPDCPALLVIVMKLPFFSIGEGLSLEFRIS